MCGLVGLIALNRGTWHSIDGGYSTIFKKMLVNARAQGTHATGVFTGIRPNLDSDDGEIIVQKAPGDPQVFVDTAEYKKVHDTFSTSRTSYLIGHSRAATNGTASNNKNNHPFVSGSIVGVHNGIISNDRQLASAEKLKLDGQCDSEVIFSIINKNRVATMSLQDAIQDTCADLNGWYACIMTDANCYHKVAIFKNRAPLDILYDSVDKVLLLASRKVWIEDALNSSASLLKNRKYEEITMESDSGVIIDTAADKSWDEVTKFSLEDDDEDLDVPPNEEIEEEWLKNYGPKKNMKLLPPHA